MCPSLGTLGYHARPLARESVKARAFVLVRIDARACVRVNAGVARAARARTPVCV